MKIEWRSVVMRYVIIGLLTLWLGGLAALLAQVPAATVVYQTPTKTVSSSVPLNSGPVVLGPDGQPINRPGSASATASQGGANSLTHPAAASVQAATRSILSRPEGLSGFIVWWAQVSARAAPLPKESARVVRLKQLTFDRKPSSILQTWAPPTSKPTVSAPSIPGGFDPRNPNMVTTPSNPGNSSSQKLMTATEKALDDEAQAFQKMVVLGEWIKVKAYLATLPVGEGTAVYDYLLRSLAMPEQPVMNPNMPMNPNVMMGFMEKTMLSIEDILGLAAAAPPPFVLSVGRQKSSPLRLTKDEIEALGKLIRDSLNNATLPEVATTRLKMEVIKPPEQAAFSARQAAQMLIAAGQASQIGTFLPTPEAARATHDLEALNLLAQYYLALHSRDRQAGYLEKAWVVTQATLEFTQDSKEEQEEALRRAVDLAPRIKEALGQRWLNESFSQQPERGMQILATTGMLAARGIATRPMQAQERLQELKLVKTAVDALLQAAPEKAKSWQQTLTLLAAAWLKEAEFSRQYDYSTGLGSRMQRDIYGNFYFVNNMDADGMQQQMMMMRQGAMPQAIVTGELLLVRPNDPWLAHVESSLKPRLYNVLAQLYLKAGEEKKAFPYLELVAASQPEQGKDLAKEFLRVWIRNHDMNQNNQNRNQYIYFYGFEERAEGIPLTRSKQERNLTELMEWVTRLRKLPIGDLDEEQLSKAFTTCHSSAEVYKLEAIEKIFGPLDKLKPRTLSGLAQTMRGNLAGLWRTPKEQEKKKTNRKNKDIEIEVLRGYEVAKGVINDGLRKFPDQWSLLLAKAALTHDEINYRAELAKTSDFSVQRNEAMRLFKLAAEAYAKVVSRLPEDEQTTQAYDQWFYACLGAVDLGMITEEKQPDWRQPPLIRAALRSLPGELAQIHMDKFANALFTRMSSAKPQIKYTYLKGGFQIVDPDHKQAVEARKVFDYYKDLVTEIKLQTKVDGSENVGHGQPFGVFVNLYHTRDIERESSGFGRYLQNQNSMYFSYNYGRPTTDYRDRFESVVKEACKDHFDVLSVTFQKPEVNSRAAAEYGWRYTPYAYLLLKAKGAQVDKLPPLRLDLDFLDTSGYVVLPIESPALPVECRAERGESRPVKKLHLTQTLDERQAEKGKLILEIRASALGLLGSWDQLLQFNPTEFDIVKVEDQGVSVAKFDTEGDSNDIVSERIWLITLHAKSGLSELPKTFKFASTKIPVHEMIYQRYQDADVVTGTEEISLEKQYGQTSKTWIVATSAVGAAGLLLIIALVVILRRKKTVTTDSQLPDKLSPFAVLRLLDQARLQGNLNAVQEAELLAARAHIEEYYFADTNGKGPPNLHEVATRWMGRQS